MSPTNFRPTGVDLLAILAVISGIIDIFGSALVLIVASLSLSWLGNLVGPGIVRLISLILSLISILLLCCGALSLFLAYGLWKGRAWAWSWARTSAIVGLALSIIALGVGVGMMGVALNALTLYYLSKNEVKAFFGGAALPESNSSPILSSMTEGFCLHCGSRFTGPETYCQRCGCKRLPTRASSPI